LSLPGNGSKKIKNITGMKLNKVACPICLSKRNFTVLYEKNFQIADLNASIFSARRLPDRVHYRMVKCNKCGLVRSNPIADTQHLGSLYKNSLLTYDEEINNLAETYMAVVSPILKKIPKGSKILEIGCGNGFVLERIYHLGYKNVFGVEPSRDAVNKAGSKIQKKVKVSMLKSGLFPRNSFDFIFFFQTFDHVPNPNQFLKECLRLLKPNGYILTFNHNVDSLSSKLLKEKSPIVDIEHTFLYSFETIRKIFENNRFVVIKIFSPKNVLSIRHLLRLCPVPRRVKVGVTKSKLKILDRKIAIRLGNLCLLAQKL
jgi:SAM-dependent methyltransferase